MTAAGNNASISGSRSTAAHSTSPAGRTATARRALTSAANQGAQAWFAAHRYQVHQHVVQLVRISRVGPDLLGDPLDGGRVQPGKLVRLDRQAAAQRHCPAAALFQRRVVEDR